MTNIPNQTTTIPTDYQTDTTSYISASNITSANGTIVPVNASVYANSPVEYPMYDAYSSQKPSPEFVKGEFAIYEAQTDYAVNQSAFVLSSRSESEDRIRDIKMKLAIRLAEGMIENNLIHFFYQDDYHRNIRKFMARAILMDKDSIKKARPR